MFGKEHNERAVSPVVGVILMVAITVILAAVIGAFVLDLGSDQEQNPTAGLTFEQGTDGSGNATVTVTVVDPGNVDSLSLSGDINTNGSGTLTDGSGGTSPELSSGGWDGSASTENTDVSAGDTATVPNEALSSTTGTVQVTGTVGTSSALIDSYEYDNS